MKNLVLNNVNYEEMEKAILENIGHTYNVKHALSEEIGNMEGCGIITTTFEMDDIKAEIEILESIEIEEDVWESRFNIEIEKVK